MFPLGRVRRADGRGSSFIPSAGRLSTPGMEAAGRPAAGAKGCSSWRAFVATAFCPLEATGLSTVVPAQRRIVDALARLKRGLWMAGAGLQTLALLAGCAGTKRVANTAKMATQPEPTETATGSKVDAGRASGHGCLASQRDILADGNGRSFVVASARVLRSGFTEFQQLLQAWVVPNRI
jgi:hypothetical protein